MCSLSQSDSFSSSDDKKGGGRKEAERKEEEEAAAEIESRPQPADEGKTKNTFFAFLIRENQTKNKKRTVISW